MTDEALDLMARKAVASATVAQLERAQAVATLDGEPFDASQLVAARLELEGLDAAEAEAVRRERSAGAELQANMQADARKTLSEALDAYMAAVGKAEDHAKAMVEEFLSAEAHAATMRKQCRALGKTVPVSIDSHGARKSLSGGFITAFAARLKGQRDFGDIDLPSVLAIPDWRAWSQKFVADAVRPYLEG